jgi:pimeloyl-ACP methyl ester carboxylesterase
MKRLLVWVLVLLVAGLVLPPLYYASSPARAPELPPAGRRVEVAPGLGVNVIESGGPGPAVVLVHGHPGSAYDWAPTQSELASRAFRVIAYDRVGYGRSDGRAPGRVLVETNASELLALLAALELSDATLVGWSYGGGVSLVAAKRDPARIARLVLVGSVGPGVEERDSLPEPVLSFLSGPVLSWVAKVPPVAARVRAATAATAFYPAPAPADFLELFAANFARPHTLQTFRSEGRDLGREADLDPSLLLRPMLVIHGDRDRLVPGDVAEKLHSLALHSRLVWVPSAGHMLPVTHAKLLADEIVEFVGPVPEPPAPEPPAGEAPAAGEAPPAEAPAAAAPPAQDTSGSP